MTDYSNIFRDRDRVDLYFHKYKYKALLYLTGIEWFRAVSSAAAFSSRLKQSLNPHPYTYYSHKENTHLTIEEMLTDKHPDNLHVIEKFVQWRGTISREDAIIRINHGKVEVYVNDLKILTDLDASLSAYNYHLILTYVEPIENFQRGVVYHKNPKYEQRIYFNWFKFSDADAKQFIHTLDDHAFAKCPSLKNSILRYLHPTASFSSRMPYTWHAGIIPSQFYIRDQQFVDFNDDSLITILAISYSEVIKKICRIEKVKQA